MDTQELANALFGASRVETTSPNTVSTVQGVAVSDSENGKVKVKLLNAESVPEDGETEDNTVVELQTTPSVQIGDVVTVTTAGGILKKMAVTGNAGSGDKQQTDTKEAAKVATNYIDIDNNNGITVGNMTEETLGHNTYINSDGVSIRDGETVLASFEDDEIALGKTSRTAEIKLINGVGRIYARCLTSSSDLFIASEEAEICLESGNPNGDNSQLWVNDKGFAFSITNSSKKLAKQLLWYSLEDDRTTCWSDFTCLGKIYQNNTPVALEGTVLFSSDTGTTSTVTLSESAANFTYLEIYYKIAGYECGCIKLYSPNGKKATLSQTYYLTGTTARTWSELITISGTSISRGTLCLTEFSGSTVKTSTNTSTHFTITRVVGIK
jgi:hypothetical protein